MHTHLQTIYRLRRWRTAPHSNEKFNTHARRADFFLLIYFFSFVCFFRILITHNLYMLVQCNHKLKSRRIHSIRRRWLELRSFRYFGDFAIEITPKNGTLYIYFLRLQKEIGCGSFGFLCEHAMCEKTQ